MNVPATSGLRNQGNTCFMNAVIQCLSNTDLFAEYFVANFYRIDRKKHCRVNSRNSASRGEVTEHLASLLKSLLSPGPHSDPSVNIRQFHQVVCKTQPLYRGSGQHDAQEFLLWLLDVIHEELNLSPRKSTKGLSQTPLHCDDTISTNGSLADHLRFNNSFIYDLFQSQLRSSLSCSCGRQSTTIDPLLCFSISIPTCLTHTVVVSVMLSDQTPHMINVSVEPNATIRELRDRISRQIRVPERRLVVVRSCLGSSFGIDELRDDSQLVQDALRDESHVYAVEVSLPADSSDFISIVFRCRDSETEQFFGRLFCCNFRRSASFRQIQLEILKCLRPILKHSLNLNALDPECMSLRICLSETRSEPLPHNVDHPLFLPVVEEAIALCESKSYRGPVHLNLIVDWKKRSSIFIETSNFPASASDPFSGNNSYSKTNDWISLQDCLDFYFTEEKLLGDNAWICPSCKKRTVSVKKLMLWTLPDVFIIHLKRFRQSSTMVRSKLSTPVSYPLRGLDMRPFLDDKSERSSRSHSNTSADHISHNRSRSVDRDSQSLPSRLVHPWRRPATRWNRLNTSYDRNQPLYDLVAVCNHTGSLLSGHYTATCRNPVNMQWYCFDDTIVTPVKEKAVVSPNAYLLFYQRSNISPSNSCDSSSGYTSSTSGDGNPNRWNNRNFPHDASSSRDSDRWTECQKIETEWSRTCSREDVRRSFPYATLTPAKPARSIYNMLFKKKNRSYATTTLPPVSRSVHRESSPQRREFTPGPLRVILPEESEQTVVPNDTSKKQDKFETEKLYWTVTSV